MDKLLERPFVKKCILIAGIAVGLYVVITWFVPLVVPFMIAFLFATLMQPVIRVLENKLHMRYRLAFVLAVVLFLVGLVLICVFSVKGIVGQTKNLVTSYPFYQARVLDGLHVCCRRIDGWLRFGEGVSYAYFTSLLNGIMATVSEQILPELTTGSVKVFCMFFHAMVFLFVTGIATLLLAKRYSLLGEQLKKDRAGQLVLTCGRKLYLALSAYLRAQLVIILCNAVVLAIVFGCIKVPCYTLVGILVAVLDALPFIGSGLILLPWAAMVLTMGNSSYALYILGGYLVCTGLRESLEPKLVGERIGISTLTSLVCMYVGLKLFGILGFLFGPVAFLIGKELYQVIWEEIK